MSDLKFLAFDIGGTKIAYAIIDEHGKVLEPGGKVFTPKTAKAIFDKLKEIVQSYEKEIDGIAIATAGEVDPQNTRIAASVGNLPEGYRNTEFTRLSAKPVYVENDANAAMWGELHIGAAKGCKDAMLVAIGTGVGVAFVIDGKLLKGKSGCAGEAHFPVNRGHKRKCTCGLYDCYEIYASGTALGLDAKEAYKDENADSHTVIKGMEKGDKLATEVFNHWQQNVIDGIVGLVNLFDSEVVILFGSLTEFMDFDTIENEVNKSIFGGPVILKRAVLENNAAMIGATIAAAQKLKGER